MKEQPGHERGEVSERPSPIDDENVMEVDSASDEDDDIQGDIERFRQERARTLYHLRRGDDDTM